MKAWFWAEDEIEARALLNSREAHVALVELERAFRSWWKYGEREAIPVDEIRQTFYEMVPTELLEDRQ
jgi:hypothetical protein